MDSTRTSLAGANWRLGLARRGGDGWAADASVAHVGPGFEINGLGFSSATEHVNASASVSYDRIEPGDLVRDYRLRASTFQNFRPGDLERGPALDPGTWRHARRDGSLWFDLNYTLNNFWVPPRLHPLPGLAAEPLRPPRLRRLRPLRRTRRPPGPPPRERVHDQGDVLVQPTMVRSS